MEYYLRVSDFKDWLDCRRRFFLKHVFGVKLDSELNPARKPTNADVGSMVDHALNAMFREAPRPPMRSAPNVPVQAGLADDFFYKEWNDAFVLADIMVDGFEEWWSEQPESAQLETLAVQEEVEYRFGPFYPLGPGGYTDYVTIIGHIDMVAWDHGHDCMSVNDVKSVATLMQHPLQIDWQMNLYALLKTLSNPSRPVGVARHIQLRRVKRTARATPPFYGLKPIIINPIQLKKVRKQLEIGLLDMLKLNPAYEQSMMEDNYYPTPNSECDWKCKVKDICAVMDDGTDWKSVVEFGYGMAEDIPVTVRNVRAEVESE